MAFNTDLNSLFKEVKVFYYKSGGPGGQRKNKKETAVKLYHPASGVWVIATEACSQALNKQIAFKRLKEKLLRLNKKRKPRIYTRLPAGIKENILQKKKLRSAKKQLRKKVEICDEY